MLQELGGVVGYQLGQSKAGARNLVHTAEGN